MEQTTTGNVGGSDLNAYHNVLMKMLPDVSGADASFTNGVPYNLNLTGDMDTTNVEEMGDLAVVVFIQDRATKKVLQTVYLDDVTSIENIELDNSVTLYPNPTQGVINVKAESAANISVFNVMGEQVASVQSSTTISKVDISNLSEGPYVVKATTNDKVITRKVILTK